MNICIFASGGGSNFNAILRAHNKGIIKSDILLLITNNSNCNAVKIAERNNIEVFHISRKLFPEIDDVEYSNKFIFKLEEKKIDFIVLAGYMKLLESSVIKKYNNKIINIHPALLPSFGGKGMYGINVHKAVLEAGVKITGITVHLVNENYDNGKILFQKAVKVNGDDTCISLQKRVLKSEHKYYPFVISQIEQNKINLSE